MNTVKGIFSKKSDEWETPADLFAEWDALYHFTLDPCCTHENAKCEKHYTIEEDGLKQSWEGEVVFCNPPYSQCEAWCRKAVNELLMHGTTTIMLLPARTDTKWFHQFVLTCGGIKFIRGRLRFNNSKQNAPFPSMIVTFSSLALALLSHKKPDAEEFIRKE